MKNLEAYFRTYGIKIAQETFPKKAPIEPVGISADLAKALDAMYEYEKERRRKIGIRPHLNGGPKNHE